MNVNVICKLLLTEYLYYMLETNITSEVIDNIEVIPNGVKWSDSYKVIFENNKFNFYKSGDIITIETNIKSIKEFILNIGGPYDIPPWYGTDDYFIDIEDMISKINIPKKENNERGKMVLSDLTEHQQQVFNSIIPDLDNIVKTGGMWDNVVSLSGPAGVGKTFLSTKLIRELIKLGHTVTLTTPTHKSLKVAKDMLKTIDIEVPASTIHSFLSLKLKPNLDTGMVQLILDDFNKMKNKTDILIVDESSMVSDELYKYIQNAIRFRKAKAVLFIGDEYQLPPVEGGENPVFLLENQHKLTEIVRQARDNPIIQLATDIRKRIESEEYIDVRELILPYSCNHIEIFRDGTEFMKDLLSSKGKDKWYDNDQILSAYTNDTVDNYNRAIRKKYWADNNQTTENEYIKIGDTLVFQEAHTDCETIIHQNNEIVIVKTAERIFNDKNHLWYWDCTDEEGVPFKVIDPLSQERYNQILKMISNSALQKKGLESRNLWQQYYAFKETFQQVKYAFSSTIHKLQGSTYEFVYIDMREIAKFFEFQKKDFIYRLMYVAVTRASKKVKILI